MKTLSLKARTDKDGIVKLEIPTNISEKEIEIVLVIQTTSDEAVDSLGYPIGYFDDTYGAFADNPIERHQPTQLDIREDLE